MAVVYLVRHGQASFGTADYDVLAATGVRQAEAAAAELRRRGVRPDRLVSGTLRRQQGTAAAMRSAGLDLPIESDPRWNEYDIADLLENHLPADAREAAPARAFGHGDTTTKVDGRAVQLALDAALQAWLLAGSESACVRTWPQYADGIAAALEELLTGLGRGGQAVVVTSGGPIAAVCARLLGLPADGFVALHRVMINCSITKVAHGRSGTSLLSLNEHAHLDAEGLLTYR
jgi:broad specificity phosphatase PhoE